MVNKSPAGIESASPAYKRGGSVPFFLFLCLLGHCAGMARASDGNELYAFGAVHKGLGGAGAAHAYDTSGIMLNPATLIELEERLDLSLELMRLHVSFDPKGVPLAVNTAGGRVSDTSYIGVPSGAYTRPWRKGVLGLGFFGTQGNRLDYPNPRTTPGFLGNGDRRSQYEVVKFPLSYAFPLGKGWSGGVGLVPTVARFRTDSITLGLLETQGNNAWDYEVGAGFNVGVQWQGERLRVGAAYHSRVWTGSYEKYRDDLLTSSFDLPQKAQAGLAWELREGLEVLLDYKWVDWTAIAQFGNQTLDGGLRWDDQHLVKAGINWNISEGWSLRGGVSHGNSPVRDYAIFVNAHTPALTETTLALGASYRINRHHEFHVSLSHVLPESRADNGQGDIFSVMGSGTRISYQEDSVTVQYTYKF